MPPVPDKAPTGRFFDRCVMKFQNWTLASNARWRLTDEQLALLWQAEFPNSRTRYTMKSVRTERHAPVVRPPLPGVALAGTGRFVAGGSGRSRGPASR